MNLQLGVSLGFEITNFKIWDPVCNEKRTLAVYKEL
jgi:hypothetical protein